MSFLWERSTVRAINDPDDLTLDDRGSWGGMGTRGPGEGTRVTVTVTFCLE